MGVVYLQLHRRWSALVLTAACMMVNPAFAANQPFQDFFFAACVNPAGNLAVRCAETNGGLGDLSSDSESSLNPSQALSGAGTALAVGRERSQKLRDRLENQRGSGRLEQQNSPRVDIGPFSLLVNVRRQNSEFDRTVDVDAERGYELDQNTLEVGLDYRMNDHLVWGALAQWTSASLEFDGEIPGQNFTPFADAGETETDTLGISVFASGEFGADFYFDASIGYSDAEVEISRNSVFQESNRLIAQTSVLTEGEADATEFSASLNIGYLGRLGTWNVSPFVGVTYVDTDVDSYSETDLTGSGLAMQVAVDDRSEVVGHAGISFSTAVSLTGWVLMPHARLEFSHAFESDRARAELAFVNDANSNVLALDGDSSDDTRLDIALGVVGVFPNGWMPFLEYQVTTGVDDLDREVVVAGIRKEF